MYGETAKNQVKSFRIREVPGGQDNISAIAWAALMSSRDIKIYSDPAVTTGCGVEAAIEVIEIY